MVKVLLVFILVSILLKYFYEKSINIWLLTRKSPLKSVFGNVLHNK